MLLIRAGEIPARVATNNTDRPSTYDLERLNDDVLLLIIHILASEELEGDSMKQLSLTSKRWRALCLPTLFKMATINCTSLYTSNPPPASWPFLRTIVFFGYFTTYSGFDRGDFLKTLPHLVALRKICFRDLQDGVYWLYLKQLSSAPAFRALEVIESSTSSHSNFHFPPDTSPASFPLTEFYYTIMDPYVSNWNGNRRPALPRRCYMSPLFLSLHQHLEVLHLPSAMAPLAQMASIDWPCLRELKLYDENYEADPTIFACLCSKMPRLRVLDLHFFHTGTSTQTLIWPPDTSFVASFSNMDTVYLPYPDPTDALYSHLPLALRELRLVDCPRYYRFNVKLTETIDGFTKPSLVTASDLLDIFGKMHGPFTAMEKLEVAFRADFNDRLLSRHIVTAFPNLRFLQLHRYRSEGESESDIDAAAESIVRDIATLSHLCHIRVYLNLPDDDFRFFFTEEESRDSRLAKRRRLVALVYRHAMAIAQNGSRALHTIDFLSTWIYRRRVWLRWSVSRDDGGNIVLQNCQDLSWDLFLSDNDP